MKNRKSLQRISTLIVALMALAMFQLIGSGCGEPDSPHAHVEHRNSRAISGAGGGRIYSFVQRQRSGTTSGHYRFINYDVRSDYTGTARVREIRATWNVDAEFRRLTSSSYTASISIGQNSTTQTIHASTTVEFQQLTVSWFASNTNGITQARHAGNYELWPQQHVNTHGIRNETYLRIDGHALAHRITAGV